MQTGTVLGFLTDDAGASFWQMTFCWSLSSERIEFLTRDAGKSSILFFLKESEWIWKRIRLVNHLSQFSFKVIVFRLATAAGNRKTEWRLLIDFFEENQDATERESGDKIALK